LTIQAGIRAHNQVSRRESIASTSLLAAAWQLEVAETTDANGGTFALNGGEQAGGKMAKHYAA